MGFTPTLKLKPFIFEILYYFWDKSGQNPVCSLNPVLFLFKPLKRFFMDLQKLIVPAIVGYGLYTYSSKAVGASKLEFYPENLDLSHIKLTNWIPDLYVRVVNPSNVSQTIDAVFLSLYANDVQLGRTQITEKLEIPKRFDKLIQFPVKIFAMGTGTIIAKLIKGEKVKFRIAGTVDTMGIAVPIDVALN